MFSRRALGQRTTSGFPVRYEKYSILPLSSISARPTDLCSQVFNRKTNCHPEERVPGERYKSRRGYYLKSKGELPGWELRLYARRMSTLRKSADGHPFDWERTVRFFVDEITQWSVLQPEPHRAELECVFQRGAMVVTMMFFVFGLHGFDPEARNRPDRRAHRPQFFRPQRRNPKKVAG